MKAVVGLAALAAYVEVARHTLRADPTPVPAPGKPRVTYDQDRNRTRVVLPPIRVTPPREAFTVTGGFECDGKEITRPDFIRLTFSANHPRALWTELDNVTLIYGDRKTNYIPFAERRGTNGAVHETATIMVPVNDFLALAKTSSVAVAVGKDLRMLKDATLAPLRALAALVPGAAGAASS